MSGQRHTGFSSAPIHTIRERNDASLERSSPGRRTGGRHHLLLAPGATFAYFQPLHAALQLETTVTLLPLADWDHLLKTGQAGVRKVGPVQRIDCVLEWNGQDEPRHRATWEAFEAGMMALTGVRPHLYLCCPVFEIWLLLHGPEPVGNPLPDCDQIRQQVTQWLQTLPEAPDPFTRTASLLPAAIARSQALTRQHLVASPPDSWPTSGSTRLHELILFWYKWVRKPLPENHI